MELDERPCQFEDPVVFGGWYYSLVYYLTLPKLIVASRTCVACTSDKLPTAKPLYYLLIHLSKATGILPRFVFLNDVTTQSKKAFTNITFEKVQYRGQSVALMKLGICIEESRKVTYETHEIPSL